MTVAPGSRLGPYEIVAPLGAGGMGEVYRARDTRLGRDVAVKILPEHLASTPDARARFEREAKAISSLNHPHICILHDVGRHEDMDYLVMELVDGETLAQRLERGPLPVDEAMRYGIQIADALDKAHRQGLVHRDLKPGNIMLTRSGAKLLDFGLARATGLAPSTGTLTSTPTVARGLTAEGTIVGTFQYMAPEQLEGREADARSDLWALGAVLYESLTGRRAFDGKSQASLIGAIMNTEPPPLSGVSALIPPALERLVRDSLAKDPEERIQTAHDMKLQLQWILEGGSQAGIPAPVAARRRHRDRLLLAVAVVSTLGFALIAGLILLRPKPRPQMIRFEIPPPSSIQFQDAPRVSPDGHFIVYNATDSLGVTRIWLRPLEALTAQALPGTEGARRPFWSPDSRFIAFVAGGKLKKMEISGAPPVVVCDAPTGSDGSWGTNGVILFDGGTTDPIRRVPASGGIAAIAVATDSTTGDAQVGWPEFLPDGRHFLYLGIGSQSTLRVGTLDSKEVRTLVPCESQLKYVQPGYLLFSRGGTLVAQRFDARALELRGEPVPIAEQVTTSAIGASEFHASDNGVLVFSATRAQVGRLVQMDRQGHDVQVLNCPPGILHPALSPDGRRIALRAFDDQSRTRDIWIVERARDIATRFTVEPSNDNYPLWAPDSKRILYYSDDSAAPGLYVKQLTGAGEKELVLPWKAGEIVPGDWSRDGRIVFFTLASPKTQEDVWTLPLTGERKAAPFLTGPFNEGHPHLSPDGRYLAYSSDESGHLEIYVQRFPDRSDKWQISTHGGSEPTWSANGDAIYYLSADQHLMSVPIRTTPSFDPGTPLSLFQVQVLNPDTPRDHYVVSDDGKDFYVTVPGGNRSLPSTFVVINWMQVLARK